MAPTKHPGFTRRESYSTALTAGSPLCARISAPSSSCWKVTAENYMAALTRRRIWSSDQCSTREGSSWRSGYQRYVHAAPMTALNGLIWLQEPALPNTVARSAKCPKAVASARNSAAFASQGLTFAFAPTASCTANLAARPAITKPQIDLRQLLQRRKQRCQGWLLSFWPPPNLQLREFTRNPYPAL